MIRAAYRRAKGQRGYPVGGYIGRSGKIDPGAVKKGGQQVGLREVGDRAAKRFDGAIGGSMSGRSDLCENMRTGQKQQKAEQPGFEGDEKLDWRLVPHGF